MNTTSTSSTQPKDSKISVDYFIGCLLGALLGDCIGALFEGQQDVPMESVEDLFQDLTNEDLTLDQLVPLEFTDDTAMLKSVAESLIRNKCFNARDVANTFVSEYFESPKRGYGGSVVDVFVKLKKDKVSDPFQPAREQFNGSGSYGNGGAMRIAPVALFAHGNIEHMLDIAAQTTKITHTHRLAVHGALLQTLAVHQALVADKSKLIDTKIFLSELKEKMKLIEQNLDEDEEESYLTQLDMIQHLLEDPNTSVKDVVRTLGHGIAAFESVPTALYVFLRSLQPIPGIECDNPVTRAIYYAITLGGDTDTIATMAGAIAGAYHGAEYIDTILVSRVEAGDYIEDLAVKLYDVVEQ
uniref:ADP-ribosylhydrolase ARH3 n=2 Tax=Cacopsylla melanoneura TaxID=428564 RepID=A0A8D8R1U4_9HEMI